MEEAEKDEEEEEEDLFGKSSRRTASLSSLDPWSKRLMLSTCLYNDVSSTLCVRLYQSVAGQEFDPQRRGRNMQWESGVRV